ncbi:hypothetical protein [Dyella sp. GSA-30]|uniref:hypothetical protein n=1 Tax=Dyella sp. GSA-30 TaxID=2994496 RepID=UPI0024916B17|nr:hypothetical protein [Dyella sp. GSA-30]BDU22220.1 hypothetical protein DYGSA30_36770 [Dyella sp. GSA-30]
MSETKLKTVLLKRELSPAERALFKQIFDHRAIRRSELAQVVNERDIIDQLNQGLKSLPGFGADEINRSAETYKESLEQALKVLIDKDVVKVQKSVIPELDTIFVTPKGFALADLVHS